MSSPYLYLWIVLRSWSKKPNSRRTATPRNSFVSPETPISFWFIFARTIPHLPTFSHLVIVNNSSFSLSLSLSPPPLSLPPPISSSLLFPAVFRLFRFCAPPLWPDPSLPPPLLPPPLLFPILQLVYTSFTLSLSLSLSLSHTHTLSLPPSLPPCLLLSVTGSLSHAASSIASLLPTHPTCLCTHT